MNGLETLLITSVEDEPPITKLFPLNYLNQKVLSELFMITQGFKKYGKGSIQHNNKIFYYRTYIPRLPQPENNNISNDILIYSYNCSKKKFFVIILCDLNYKKNYIDNLINEIFDVLDNDGLEDNNIKIESCHKINTLFEKYKKLQPNFSKNNQLKEMNVITDSAVQRCSINDSNSHEENKNKIINKKLKRIDSRIVLPKTKNQNKTSGYSVDIDDLTTLKESDTNLTLMFKNQYDRKIYISNTNKWKNIKILNIILCSFFLLISMILMLVMLY